ncbi:MAG TPA: DUF3426 domain-containing protein [Burkholderiales bacterium]|nr:DUF3426 domain-containing protein [Burkholderiales bacterium]
MSAVVTRCPQCSTAFRALEEQLAARGGLVRCGKCAAVFDGNAHRMEDGSPAEPSPQLRLFEPGSAPGAQSAAARSASATASPAAAAGRGASAPKATARADEDPLPGFLEEEVPRARFTALWALGALLAFAALLAQLALYYRTELATLVPQTRPHLAEACRLLGCELRLPRRPDLLSLESSDLQADTRREGLIVLNAVIRNRAPFAQEHPALELTLTDAADKAVVRRVLQPADYLSAPARATLAQGIAAGGESVLRVHFDTRGVRATGYRVYLFYPS